MSTHWLVGPLVGWLLAGWSYGPLVRPPCRGYRNDAANLGWFNSQLPSQSLCLNATPDSNGDLSKGWSKQVVMDRYDTSKAALVVEKYCKSLGFLEFFFFCNFAFSDFLSACVSVCLCICQSISLCVR